MKLRLMICLLPVVVGCSQPQQQAQTETQQQPTQAMETLPENLKQFAWLQGADSKVDAEAAVAKKDFRLLAVSGRGLMIPGIAVEDREAAKNKCGIRYMEGMGDVIQPDPEFRKWRKKGSEYAKAYNAIVHKHCM